MSRSLKSNVGIVAGELEDKPFAPEPGPVPLVTTQYETLMHRRLVAVVARAGSYRNATAANCAVAFGVSPVLKDRLGIPIRRRSPRYRFAPPQCSGAPERGTKTPFLGPASRSALRGRCRVVGEFAAEIVFEVAASQAGKEVSGEEAEVPDSGELANRAPHSSGSVPNSPGSSRLASVARVWPRHAARSLRIGTPSSARHVPINALDDRSYDVDQTGISAGVQVEALQGADEVG